MKRYCFPDAYHTTFPLSSKIAVGVSGMYKGHPGQGKTNTVVKDSRPNLPVFSLFLGAFYVTLVKYTPVLYSVAMQNQKMT